MGFHPQWQQFRVGGTWCQHMLCHGSSLLPVRGSAEINNQSLVSAPETDAALRPAGNRTQHLPQPVARRLEPAQPAEAGRQADAPTYICPKAQDGPSSSDQRPLPSGGAAGAFFVVQRIHRLAEDQVAAVVAERDGKHQSVNRSELSSLHHIPFSSAEGHGGLLNLSPSRDMSEVTTAPKSQLKRRLKPTGKRAQQIIRDQMS